VIREPLHRHWMLPIAKTAHGSIQQKVAQCNGYRRNWRRVCAFVAPPSWRRFLHCVAQAEVFSLMTCFTLGWAGEGGRENEAARREGPSWKTSRLRSIELFPG